MLYFFIYYHTIKLTHPGGAKMILAMQRYGGGVIVCSLTLGYTKRLFPDSNP